MSTITNRELVRSFKTFDLWREDHEVGAEGERLTMEVYRSKDGAYITAKQRRRPGIIKAIARLGITPELTTGDTCCIGKSEVDGKWYGWSHRAMVGFGLGDRVFEERFGDDNTPFTQHGRKAITTDNQARAAAAAFARYVS